MESKFIVDGIFYLIISFGLIYVVHLLYQTEKSNNTQKRELRNEIKELEIKTVSDDHKWLIATLLYVIKIRANFFKTGKNIEFDQRERHAEVRRVQNKLEIKSSVYEEISGNISKYIELKPKEKDAFDFYLNCVADMIFSEKDPTEAELVYLKELCLDKLSYTNRDFEKFISEKSDYIQQRIPKEPKLNSVQLDKTPDARIIDSLNSQTPVYADDIIVKSEDNSYYQNVVLDQINFSKSDGLKEGWNINPKHPIKIYVIEGTPENINNISSEKSVLIANDHEFAWSNFLDYFSDNFFFHREIKMQIPKEHLDKVLVTDYYEVTDFESRRKLGDRLERHYWSIINSFLLESKTDDESKKMVIFALKQLNSILFHLERYEEGNELLKFALMLGEEKDIYFEIGINHIMRDEYEEGYASLLMCSQTYINEGGSLPDDITYEFLVSCYLANKKKEAEKLLKSVEGVNFEASWLRVHHNLTLKTSLDHRQSSALKTLLNLIIGLSEEPFRSEKIYRLEAISKKYKINWDEIEFDHDLMALTKNINEEAFERLQDSSHQIFSSLKVLDLESKRSILELVKYFINPIKRNGMLIETSGAEALLLVVFAVSADLPCEEEHAKQIFSNGLNLDKFYAFWGLNNPF